MDLRLFSYILSTWTQVQIWSGVAFGCQPNLAVCLSEKDISLFDADENPKCFTRTMKDFTCFWEASNEKSYDFFYKNDIEKKCSLTQQKLENRRFLHICSLPPSDVYLYDSTNIRVVEGGTNNTVYSRSANVEDLVLLDPPTNVSLHLSEEPGELLVTWCAPSVLRTDMQYEIQYFSQSMMERIKLIKHSRSSAYKLDFLHPGEVCHVQMRVMPGGYSLKGHWSEWSSPASAMVPQWAADIDLLCHTSDLRNVQCRWNKRRDGEEPSYTLFYKFSHSHSWQECIPTESANQCIFYGEQSSSIRVNLRTGPGPHSCSFFSDSFTMNNCIKTEPPSKLHWQGEGARVHLLWEPPRCNLSTHLIYQLRYSSWGESGWKLVTLQSSKTWTSLDLQAGVQYSVQIQAKPNGSIYNGFWSDWSNSTIVHVPTGTGNLVAAGIPFILLFIAVLMIASFSKYARKVKQLLWPPVPNLQKVLEGFLTDISRQYQSSPITIKQCYEDIPASVVEIVSGTEVLGSGKAHKEGVLALFPNPELEAKLAEEYAMEAYSDYVTLNTQNVFPCLRSNEYVPGDGRSLSAGPEVLQRGFLCSCDTSQNLLLPSTEILNHSYLLLAEPAEDLAFKDSRGLSSRYTNLEHPALHTSAD
ncbi:thrombopoietin receptor [Scleropages formosus]|nr:thrombopoietin receptor [Scleropages formosus]